MFRKWFGKSYDIDILDAVMATAAADRLAGDPLWLLVISGPGNAKTETVQSLVGAGAHVTSTIASEGALLSGSPRKERAKGATGGLLREIGDQGLLVLKDVTSILSADRNVRTGVLAALPRDLRRTLGAQCRYRRRSHPDLDRPPHRRRRLHHSLGFRARRDRSYGRPLRPDPLGFHDRTRRGRQPSDSQHRTGTDDAG